MSQYFEVPKKIRIPVSTRNQVAAKPVEEQLYREQGNEDTLLY